MRLYAVLGTHGQDMWYGAQALVVFSRVGVYMRVPGVDAERFAEAVQSQGILGYIDTLSGGSISRVGIFSLGTIPTYKNSWLRQDVSLPEYVSRVLVLVPSLHNLSALHVWS